MFKKGEVALHEWQYSGDFEELIQRSPFLLKDRQLAYPFMLSDETHRVHWSKERLNFFANQMRDEVVRVGLDNGGPMIEHFVGQAQMQVEYID